MKLFSVSFDSPQYFATVNAVVKKADPRAVVTINESSGYNAFETQSEKAANAIVEELGGTLTVIEYDVKDIMR